eukprot:CAMPEP_0170474470 /NCGR_PEP_ID=MMETSP0123-20130129/16260_1 /TAXON_ID=182087 /ORGANISM="Favella ehrenbergii, Strain Fehren 1" /LENGTH=42 /DNA_ID= /DNA_START= /DNA_END= /DNA_ORIENTATION=
MAYYICLTIIAVLVFLINSGNMVWYNLFGDILFSSSEEAVEG